MDRTRPNAEVSPKPRGLLGDVHQLQVSSAATAVELRDFVRQLRGKNPQEMLGIVAQSGLLRAVAQAALITAILMVACTVGPYYWNKANSATAAATSAPSATVASGVKSENEKPKVAVPTQPAVTDTVAKSKVAQDKPPAADNSKLLKKLDMDEAKKADPNANPLENKADDLLKDLK